MGVCLAVTAAGGAFRVDAREIKEVAIVGNSLSYHGPAPQIGWSGSWGMAATDRNGDYVHLLYRMICDKLAGTQKTVPELKQLGGAVSEKDFSKWDAGKARDADIIIIQKGDNYRGPVTEEKLQIPYAAMLRDFKNCRTPSPIVISVSNWGGGKMGELLEAAAKSQGVTFVSLKQIAEDPRNRAKSEGNFTHGGVNWHPGNRGMREIANAIWRQLEPEIDRLNDSNAPEKYAGSVTEAADAYRALLQRGGSSQCKGPESAAANAALRANAVYPVVYSPKTRMNGTLADWEDIPIAGHLTVPAACFGPVPETLSAYFKAAASDRYLYLLAAVQDGRPQFGQTPLYNSDCFEIFLDPFFSRGLRADDSTLQIFASLEKDGKTPCFSGKLIPAARPVPVPGGWGMELAIPLDNPYFKADIFDGLTLGFNISYDNNDAGRGREQKLTWSGIDTEDGSWRNPSVFGALKFVRSDARPVRPVAQGPAILANRTRRQAGETLKDCSVLAHSRPHPERVYGFQSGDLRNGQSFKDMVADWNAGAVRLQLHQLGPNPTWKPNNFPIFLDRLENAVKQARDAGLKIIPVLYEVPFDLNGRNMWNCPELEKAYTDYWLAVIKRLQPYKDAIWGYDLINEPLDHSQLPYAPLQWRALAVKLIRAIRRIDPDAWIVYEAGPGGDWRGFEDLKPLPDDKVIYSLHFYEPGAFTHQGIAATKLQDPNLIAKAQEKVGIRYPGVISGIAWDRARFEEALKPVIDFQNQYKVPIYVGEFSVIAWAPPECSAQYLKDVTDIFDKYGWSWTYHAFREYGGWRLDVEEGVFRPKGGLLHVPETRRGAVIKAALKRHTKQN